MIQVLEYLAIPWAPGAKGPDAFSCWGLLQYIYKKDLNINLPDYVVENWNCVSDFVDVFDKERESKENWFDVQSPQEYDAVLLGRSRYPSHVGIWVGAPDLAHGRIMHCLQPFESNAGVGVVAQKVSSLTQHGWGYVKFLRNKQYAEHRLSDAS